MSITDAMSNSPTTHWNHLLQCATLAYSIETVSDDAKQGKLNTSMNEKGRETCQEEYQQQQGRKTLNTTAYNSSGSNEKASSRYGYRICELRYKEDFKLRIGDEYSRLPVSTGKTSIETIGLPKYDEMKMGNSTIQRPKGTICKYYYRKPEESVRKLGIKPGGLEFNKDLCGRERRQRENISKTQVQTSKLGKKPKVTEKVNEIEAPNIIPIVSALSSKRGHQVCNFRYRKSFKLRLGREYCNLPISKCNTSRDFIDIPKYNIMVNEKETYGQPPKEHLCNYKYKPETKLFMFGIKPDEDELNASLSKTKRRSLIMFYVHINAYLRFKNIFGHGT